MPTVIFDEFVVGTQIHRHRLSANGAFWHEIRRYFHILLLGNHLLNDFLVVIGFIMARNTALKKTVIPLGIKQPLFIESRFLETVVNVCRDNEVIFVFYEFIKFVINRFRRIGITIYKNISRPVRPELFGSIVRIKPTRIHIVKIVFRFEIVKILMKTLPRISKTRSSRKPCARAYHDCIRVFDKRLQLICFFRVFVCIIHSLPP